MPNRQLDRVSSKRTKKSPDDYDDDHDDDDTASPVSKIQVLQYYVLEIHLRRWCETRTDAVFALCMQPKELDTFGYESEFSVKTAEQTKIKQRPLIEMRGLWNNFQTQTRTVGYTKEPTTTSIGSSAIPIDTACNENHPCIYYPRTPKHP